MIENYARKRADPHVHHIDCRGFLDPKQDWVNELHPTAKGFGKIAAKFDQVLQAFFRKKLAPVPS